MWHCIWVSHGRPHLGDVAERRRITRARYHQVVSKCRSDEERLRMEAMAAALMSSDTRKFWQEVSRMKGRHTDFVRKVNDAHTSQGIADLFCAKYNALFNSVATDDHELSELLRRINASLEDCPQVIVGPEVIDVAFNRLKEGKSSGPEGIMSDHIIHAPCSFKPLFARLLSSLYLHGVCPSSMASGTLRLPYQSARSNRRRTPLTTD